MLFCTPLPSLGESTNLSFSELRSGLCSGQFGEQRDCDLIVSTKFTTGPYVFWEKEGGVEIHSKVNDLYKSKREIVQESKTVNFEME